MFATKASELFVLHKHEVLLNTFVKYKKKKLLEFLFFSTNVFDYSFNYLCNIYN